MTLPKPFSQIDSKLGYDSNQYSVYVDTTYTVRQDYNDSYVRDFTIGVFTFKQTSPTEFNYSIYVWSGNVECAGKAYLEEKLGCKLEFSDTHYGNGHGGGYLQIVEKSEDHE